VSSLQDSVLAACAHSTEEFLCQETAGFILPALWLQISPDLYPVYYPTRFGAAGSSSCTRSQTRLGSAETATGRSDEMTSNRQQ